VIGGGSAEGGAVERHMLPMIRGRCEGRRLLADRPEDIVDQLKAVEKPYPGLDRVICAPLDHDGGPALVYAAFLKSPICASSARLKAGRAVQRST